ncbi:membrane-spanning 4-domains subfamily A member 6C isoform X2 [Nothobranchius furzeri]|uniref:membrane-spanning 4-domains subfamily A member 6C isoform X2 n=1 Tax=Nothobranchius furzeri TaxID=105023 RepID=UPI003904DA21
MFLSWSGNSLGFPWRSWIKWLKRGAGRMSVTMSKADGVTVFTVASDPDSQWPPLCQILKSLCYSRVCCSVSPQLKKIQRTSLSVLGALQIMIGLLNIGLGIIIHQSYFEGGWFVVYIGLPYWLGVLVILFGIMCILSERYPSPCLVILNVTLNLTGIAFAITGIVLYSCSVPLSRYWSNCNRTDYYSGYWQRTTQSPSAEEINLKNKCLEGEDLIVMLMRGMYGVLIILCVLELCIVISVVVMGIKALKTRNKKTNKSSDDGDDEELFNPLLEDNTKSAA